jgi:flagellar motor switch protein FliM
MGAGGIIQKRAAALLVAVTDSSFYDSLIPANKSKADAIDAKGPDQRTHDDVCTLAHILNETAKHT